MNLIDSALLTDLYGFAMLQTYHAERMSETAVFELFTRRLPPERNFLIAAGLEQVLDYLEKLHFLPKNWTGWPIAAALAPISLPRWRHSGLPARFMRSRRAAPFFANEPVLRITAPLSQAQLVESRLINLIHFQTVIASKAARCVLAAPDKLLVDFGMRRAHGAEAALLAARAAYLTGFAGTATVLAGMKFGIPLFGTMAHSLIQAYEREDAFESFAIAQPGNVVLLIDTSTPKPPRINWLNWLHACANMALRSKGCRLSSGDLAEHARQVRRILDAGALTDVTLFGSSDLDEHRLGELLAVGAPFDGFGISTRSMPLPMRQRWIWFTSCKSTRASQNASGRRVRRPGRVASRFIGKPMPMDS